MSRNLHTTAGKIEDLRARVEEAVHAGSARAVEKQHAKGKHTARERIEMLVDADSFTEIDEFARHRSTQSDLIELVTRGSAQAGDVVVADYQSSGRGRLTRTFEAAPGTALLFSFYIRPTRNKNEWGWIPLIAGVSVAQSLPGVDARVKWPNDILINEKKISGLIAQVVGDGVVIGIGINVGMQSSELPVAHATSLAIEGTINMSRNELLINLLSTFETNFTAWDQGNDQIKAIYRDIS